MRVSVLAKKGKEKEKVRILREKVKDGERTVAKTVARAKDGEAEKDQE